MYSLTPVPQWLSGANKTALQWGPGLFETLKNLKLPILDDFRPRITMGNPIVTEILGFSDVGFSKNEKFSAKKSKK